MYRISVMLLDFVEFSILGDRIFVYLYTPIENHFLVDTDLFSFGGWLDYQIN